jgi:hypothetical protein
MIMSRVSRSGARLVLVARAALRSRTRAGMIASDLPLLEPPLYQMSFAGVIAIAVAMSVLWWGSAGAAGPLRPFKHGFWSGGAYTDDRAGIFTHCSAGVAYDSGINLFLLLTRSHSWWLGFIDPQWSLPAASNLSVQLRLDDHPPFGQVATMPSKEVLLVPLPDSSRLIHAFRRASKLDLVAEGRSFFFELRGSSAVMDRLTSCVHGSIALEAQGTPAESAGRTVPTSSPGAPRAPIAAAAPATASAIGVSASSASSPIATLVATEAETPSPVSTWFSIVALSALMGIAGQGIRVFVGLMKVRDEAAALGHKFIKAVEPTRLTISLLIGAVAGVAAAIVVAPVSPVSRAALLGLGAAGYSGADLVEGLMARYLSNWTRPPSRFGAPRRRGWRRDDA